MNKKFFLPIVAGLVLTAIFFSCQKDNGDDGNKVKLLETESYSVGGHSRYEYDTQNRLTKIYKYSNGGERFYTLTLTYSGDDLVQYNDFTIDFPYSANKMTYSDGSNTNTFDLNSDGSLAKASASYVTNGYNCVSSYQYQNGNLTKVIEEWSNEVYQSVVTTREYTYDNMKSPFINCKTPMWCLTWFVNIERSYCNNNSIEFTQTNSEISSNLVFSYEYDNEGYPTRCSYEVGNEVITVSYSYNK